MRVFTLGYQGLNLAAYVRELQRAGAGAVIDVREKPWSNRPDFIKGPLGDGLARGGIDYIHVAAAGNPASIRKTTASAEECLGRYREHLVAHPEAVEELYSYVRLAVEKGRPACLTCYERLPEHCHRSVLIEFLMRLDRRVSAVHLPLATSEDMRPFRRLGSPLRSLQETAFIHPARFRFSGRG
ncbi:MAG TPA: DUF488 domain-containing protein [Pyrinomonadaceae bacterium]|nr:DUF488 domain-containing protein [Pyrinomonadaceae bacterium]